MTPSFIVYNADINVGEVIKTNLKIASEEVKTGH